ncbi:MAG: protein kinase [Planctomycetes bacterium]|nr:protein kinase [Planctomycetota bacterium]
MTDAPSLESIVAGLLERIDAEGSAAIDAICAAHPDRAEAIRTAVERLASFGLLERRSPIVGLPDRLGPFRLIETIGTGGMGVVVLAEEMNPPRRVALKLIRPDLLALPGAHERFRREIESIARLQHRSIATIHTVGEDAGIPYFSMEWIRGRSLEEIIDAWSVRPPVKWSGASLDEALRAGADDVVARSSSTPDSLFAGPWWSCATRIARAIAEALDHAHRHGVVHRDVKPSNVLVTEEGRVVLIDFGLARPEGVDRMTKSGAPLGSLPYMSPEQLRAGEVGPRSDVYSLAVTLRELLTLEHPFVDDDPEELRRSIVEGRSRRFRARDPGTPIELEVVTALGMDVDPERRYSDAAAFIADLDAVLARRPIVARRMSWWLRARRWTHRRPARAIGALFVVACVGLGITGVALWRRSERVARESRVLDLDTERATFRPPDPARLQAIDRWLSEAARLVERRDEILAGAADERRAELSGALDRLDSDVDSVRRLRLEARRFDRENRSPAWAAARRAIATSDRYAGLDLSPQSGLRPIGRDPATGLWEFLHLMSTDDDDAEHSGIVMVLVPGGAAWIGAKSHPDDPPVDCPNVDPALDPTRQQCSGPCRVNLPPLFVAKHELTRAQWARIRHWFNDEPPSLPKNPDHPRCGVNGNDLDRHLERVGLRLPTEIEWEVFARAGTTTRFYSGDDLESLASFENVASESGPRAIDIGGRHSPNPWGLYDIHGNSREWCANGFTSAERSDALRAVRGGDATMFPPRGSAFRSAHPADKGDGTIGARPVRTVE